MFGLKKKALSIAFSLGVATDSMKAAYHTNMLDSPDQGERFVAAEELAKLYHSNDSNVSELARFGLHKALVADPQKPVRRAISTLFSDGHFDVHMAISDILRNPDPDIRYECILAMEDIDTLGDTLQKKVLRNEVQAFLNNALREEEDEEWKQSIRHYLNQVESGERMGLPRHLVYEVKIQAHI